MNEQLARRWKHEACEGQQGVAPNTYEVMTADDASLHVCYVFGETMAEHLVELHNRTLGDGQEPADPTLRAEHDRLVHDLRDARESGHRRAVVHIDVRERVMEMVENLIHERVALYASREPARIVIDGNPVAMANVLSKLGYVVFEDQASYRRQLLDELGKWPVVVGLDSDIVRMVDVLRKRGYTVFAPDHVFEGTPTAGVPVDTETLISILERRGYQVAQKVSPE